MSSSSGGGGGCGSRVTGAEVNEGGAGDGGASGDAREAFDTNDKSDTRGQAMVKEALEATVISSSSQSNLSLQKGELLVASVNQLTLVRQHQKSYSKQQWHSLAQSEQQRQQQLLFSPPISLAVNNGHSSNSNSNSISCAPCSKPAADSIVTSSSSTTTTTTTTTPTTTTTATTANENCNICHQEILATTSQTKSNQNLFGGTTPTATYSHQQQVPIGAPAYLGQTNQPKDCLESTSLGAINKLCISCGPSGQNHPTTTNATKSDSAEQSAAAATNLNHNSFLFWKFLSNLPRSITQRSKSDQSSTLTPEVVGYLASKQFCEKDENNLMSIMSSTTTTAAAAAAAANNNNYNIMDEARNILNKTIKSATATTVNVNSPAERTTNTGSTSDCHLSREEHKSINIVVPSLDDDPNNDQHRQQDALLHEQQQADQKHLGSQIKLSIATTTTATRSSASSLSSCILSESSNASGEERLKWGKKMDFLLSIIGFAVDLANIWRFPYLVYKNGGGVFLIPYVTMLLFGGIPLFFLELCLGQYVKKGPITVWNKICPAMKGVGYCSIMISWYVSFYYNVLIAWSVYFIYRSLLSFGDKMPWEECDNSWNSNTTCVSISQLKNTCMARNEPLDTCRKSMYIANVTSPASEFFVKELSQIDQSTGLEDMGHLRMELVLCLLIVYLLHYFSLFRGLETSGKVVWVTATAPYMILSILLIRGLFLPGASMGIEYYLSPNLDKLRDPQVWIDAAGQVFYSIGVGFGVHLTYASFNSHNNNCYRDCLMTSAVNVITSVYSGLVVFVYLGYMASNLGIQIDQVANEGYSLVFEVYPEALTTLPFARFWSILFFIMLLTLGIDSAMGGLEAVITGLEDEFKFAKRLSRGQLTGLVIVSSFLPALISCTQGGAYTLYWFDIYSAGISLLFAALFETVGVVYCYGLKKFIANIESMLGKAPHIFFIICWKYISPLFLGGVIFMQIYTASKITYRGYTYPTWSIVLGWCLAFSSVAAIPIVAICYWYNHGFRKAIPDKNSRKRAGTSSASSSKHGSSKKSPNHKSVSQVCYSAQNTGGPVTTILTKQSDQLNQYSHQGSDTMSCRTREEML